MNCNSLELTARSKKNVFFRIREVNGQYMASLKECLTPHVERDGSITRYYKEVELDPLVARRIIQTPSQLLTVEGYSSFIHIVTFFNTYLTHSRLNPSNPLDFSRITEFNASGKAKTSYWIILFTHSRNATNAK